MIYLVKGRRFNVTGEAAMGEGAMRGEYDNERVTRDVTRITGLG